MSTNHNYLVIMAGGIGSRFWPLSRMSVPKQFIDFFATGKTLLRQTYERFCQIVPADHIIVSTNLSYMDLVLEQLPEIDPLNILREPAFRGTAPSVALAAYYLRTIDPEANIVMVPADQYIVNEEAFRTDMLRALDYTATHPHLVTVGIKPTHPETRYGYIQVDEERPADGFCKIKTFTEKPQPDFARIFMESGEFYWNTGLFIWRAQTIIDTMHVLLPDMMMQLDRVFDGNRTRDERREELYRCYESFIHISIDYAVIEKAPNMYMLSGSYGWMDIGRWEDVWQESEKDADGNVVHSGNCELYDCRNNLIILPDDKKTIIQGLEGFFFCSTDDVVVICPLDEKNIRHFRGDLQAKGEEKLM